MNTIPNDGLIRYKVFFGKYFLMPTTPKILSELLVTKSYDFQKSEGGRNVLRMTLGDGLVVSEGETHKFQRKNLQPMFSFRHIKELYPLMWKKSIEMTNCVKADILNSGDSTGKNGFMLDVSEWASKATLDIIGVAALGYEFNTLHSSDNELAHEYQWLFTTDRMKVVWMLTNIIAPRSIVKWIPWKIEKKVMNVSINLRRICGNLVSGKRQDMKVESTESVDILAHLIRSNNFSDDELVDQLLTFLAAG
jgi:cytochrome P450